MEQAWLDEVATTVARQPHKPFPDGYPDKLYSQFRCPDCRSQHFNYIEERGEGAVGIRCRMASPQYPGDRTPCGWGYFWGGAEAVATQPAIAVEQPRQRADPEAELLRQLSESDTAHLVAHAIARWLDSLSPMQQITAAVLLKVLMAKKKAPPQ